jgi:hypothetical protein
MDDPVTVRELFRAANLSPCGPVKWGDPLSEDQSGVYVVASVRSADAHGDRLDVRDVLTSRNREEHRYWVTAQPILYIGRTQVSLRQRLNQFYRHKYEIAVRTEAVRRWSF